MATKHDLGCVFIDTEKKLSLGRLKEMAQERAMTSLVASSSTQVNEDDQGVGAFSYTAAAMSATGPEESAPIGSLRQQADQRPFKSARQVLTNTTVHSPGSTIELLDVINGLEEEILLRNENASSANDGTFPVGLVILDSIAAPARRDFGKESAPQRVSALLQIAQTLKRLADQLQIAVVVINQVGQQDSGGGDFVSVQAALGTAWHHCVSTRLLMENEQDDGSAGPWEGGVASKQTRRATVVKSTDAGEASMMFTVQSLGLTEAESS
jgi:RecA/RadA recombinase